MSKPKKVKCEDCGCELFEQRANALVSIKKKGNNISRKIEEIDLDDDDGIICSECGSFINC